MVVHVVVPVAPITRNTSRQKCNNSGKRIFSEVLLLLLAVHPILAIIDKYCAIWINPNWAIALWEYENMGKNTTQFLRSNGKSLLKTICQNIPGLIVKHTTYESKTPYPFF